MGFKLPKIKIKAPKLSDVTRALNPYTATTDLYGSISKDKKVTDAAKWLNPNTASAEFYKGFMPTSGKKGESVEAKRAREALELQRYGLLNEANQFEKDLPSIQRESFAAQDRLASLAEKQGVEGIQSGYQSRGLLHSGLRAEKEGGLRSELAGQLAKQKMDINRELVQSARAKKEAASSINLEIMRDNLDRADRLYDLQMQNQLARQQAFGQLAQGFGSAAGAYYGSRQSPSSSGNTPDGGFSSAGQSYLSNRRWA